MSNTLLVITYGDNDNEAVVNAKKEEFIMHAINSHLDGDIQGGENAKEAEAYGNLYAWLCDGVDREEPLIKPIFRFYNIVTDGEKSLLSTAMTTVSVKKIFKYYKEKFADNPNVSLDKFSLELHELCSYPRWVKAG